MSTARRTKGMLATPLLFWRALVMTWQAHRLLALATLALVTFSALMPPLQVWMTSVAIDAVTAVATRGGAAATNPATWQPLLGPVALYLLVWAIGQIATALDGAVRDLMGLQVDGYVQRRIFAQAAQLDISYFENPALCDQFTLAKSEAYRITGVFYQFAALVQNALTAVTLLVLLGQISLWITVVLLLTTLPRLVGVVHFTRRRADLYVRAVPEQRLTGYLSWLMGERDVVKEIRLFQIHDYLIGRMRAANQKYFGAIAGVVVTQERTLLLLTLVMLVGIASVWGYTIWLAAAGLITLGSMALIFQAVERTRDTLLSFGFSGGFFAENGAYLQNMFDFLDRRPEAVPGALARPAEAKGVAADLSGPIVFDQVSFRYPGSDTPVLDRVSFVIAPGETIALVGENGAGKTTLVKLLTRLYDPTDGAITIAGRDLRAIDPQLYYRQIGAIFQDFWHYDLSIRENIGFGNLAQLDNLDRIRQAAAMSGAAELVESFPRQYETMLGRVFYEDSKDLSGGQWQTIGLARAFMRDVPLLILDEPTAALDAFAENAVYNRFTELTRGRTTVFVTHRLSSVRLAGKILVLKDGRLVETGTHDQLLARDGLYAGMFRVQAERYQTNA